MVASSTSGLSSAFGSLYSAYASSASFQRSNNEVVVSAVAEEPSPPVAATRSTRFRRFTHLKDQQSQQVVAAATPNRQRSLKPSKISLSASANPQSKPITLAGAFLEQMAALSISAKKASVSVDIDDEDIARSSILDLDEDQNFPKTCRFAKFKHLLPAGPSAKPFPDVTCAVDLPDQRPRLKPCGIIQFPTPGKPEDSQFDVYLRAPKQDTEMHFGAAFIRSTPAEIMVCAKEKIPAHQGKYVNIFYRYRPQIQAADQRIGFAVLMNGINVEPQDLQQYTQILYHKINDRIPTIGIYNTSHGAVPDVLRLGVETCLPLLENLVTNSIKIMRVFLETLTCHFYLERVSIGSRTHFLMVVHSEGGLILHKAMKALDGRTKDAVRNHMYILSFGSVRPLPDKYGVRVINIYSKKDYATYSFANAYRGKAGYTIEDVDCHSKHEDRILRIIDHAFLAGTYQEQLTEKLKFLDAQVGFGPKPYADNMSHQVV